MSKLRRLACATWAFGLVLAFVSGCGDDDGDEGPSPTEQCNEVAKTECHRIFLCTTELERTLAGLPPGLTELGCVIGLAGAGQLECEKATAAKICPGDQGYDATKAKACVAEANAASCEVIKANYPNVTPYAPSCSQCVPQF